MAKQLNVNLGFTADTTQARQQIKNLQADLMKLSSMSAIGTFNNADMEKAITAAKNLQMHLNNAINVDTGKLDLSRFSKSLSSANQSLASLRKDLSLAGEQGNQAFLQLARSISQAEAPALRISNTFKQMGNTLKNTIRWQLSSSLLHGFVGVIQDAYGYAQDLDESLNNIRIVAGQSKEEMKEFAEQANRAAKALNTTTTAYTNAALIYYQQGDDDETVLQKTDVTAKMANVTGQSAEVVSDQLTAIWNNFNKAGEESYEHYADVLTALGAATASSTDEIAGGLEKFSSIADMIGLSYEYAATALATITATTRQSEDVVGTALKTIFARIQGLNLGETLEDGTTLNKYSEALSKIGVSIYDASGGLKDMNSILDEMGSKWETLNKDQQVALAQTVAGVRQYNQLVSLMDNWDFFKENLNIAEGSEGTLNAQAAIYAESWEAASKRVKAATEDVFDSLIDDEFFIGLTNGFADFIDGIATITDAMGGMKGVITLITSLFLTSFAKEIPGAIQKLTSNFDVLTGKAQQAAINTMGQTKAALSDFTSDKMTNALDAELTGLTKVVSMKKTLAETSHILTTAEKQQFEQEIQMIEAAGQMVVKEGEKVDAIERTINANVRKLARETSQTAQGSNQGSNFNANNKQAEAISVELGKLKELTNQYVACEQVVKRLKVANETWLTSGDVSSTSMIKNMRIFKQSFIDARGGVDNLSKSQKAMCDKLEQEIAEANGDVDKLKAAFENFGKSVKKSLNTGVFERMDQEIAQLEQKLRGMGVDNEALNKLEQEFREGAISADEYRQKLLALQHAEEGTVNHAVKMSETIGFIGAKMMQVSMAANALKSAWNIWSDEDASLGEKILTTMTSLSMILPVLTAVTNSNNAAQTASHAINLANLGVKLKLPFAEKLQTAATAALTAAKAAETGMVKANTVAWYANPIMWIALIVMGVVAAIVALIAGIKRLTEWIIKGNRIETENCETLIENAKKTRELADANEELSNSMDSLIEQYKTMSAAGEDTTETLAEIKSKIPELIKSYKELAKSMGLPTEAIEKLQHAANLGILTGDFTDFNNQKEELDKQLAIETAKSQKSGSVAASTQLASKMRDEQGRVSGASYKLHVGGVEMWGEEKASQDIVLREMGDYAKQKTLGGGVDLTVSNFANPVELVDYYEKMVAARDAMLNELSEKELKSSDTFREINEIIAATASEYKTAKEQAESYIEVAGKALEAELGDGSNLTSMEEYLAYRKEYIKLATESYGLTQEQAEAYLQESSNLSKVAKEYQLAMVMAKQYGNIDVKDPKFAVAADDYYKTFAKQLEAAYGDISDLELSAAINVAMNTDSIEEFSEQFQMTMIKMTAQSYANSAATAKQVMAQAAEDGSVNLSSLLNDENFIAYLEEIGVSTVAITTKTYEEQYAIISKYYSDLSTKVFDSFTSQQELNYQSMANLQEQLSAYWTIINGADEEAKERVKTLKAEYASFQSQLQNTTDKTQIQNIKEQMEELEKDFRQEFGFEIESNAETIQNEINGLLDSIQQLQDKKIELAMDWSGTDDLESGMEKAAEFAALIGKEVKKTGTHYEMTAAQAKEWLKFYPKLGEIAETTDKGIIKMDAKVVDEFIQGKEDALDASIEARIIELEGQKAVLAGELEVKQKELTAAGELAKGKMQLDDISAQYLTDLRSNLVQYFIDLGMDEVNANKAALETMHLNEKEYSDKVAQACETNAKNMTYAAEDGANAQVDALSQVIEKWKNFGRYLIDNIGPILRDIGAAILDPNKTVGDVLLEAWNATPIDVDDSGNTYEGTDLGDDFTGLDPHEIQAAMEEVSAAQLEDVQKIIDELTAGINAIDGQIDYLKALKNQDLEDFGIEDVDDINDTGEALAKLAERYHEITREIVAQEHALDRLSKQKDRAFGLDKLQYIDKEIEGYQNLLEEQNKLYLLRAADVALDQQALQNQFGNKVDFNKDTFEINNFTELYNKATEEQRKLLEEYEKSIDALRDQENVLYDITTTLQDLELERITVEVETEVEISQRDLDRLEYIIDKLGRNVNNMIEIIDALGQQVGKYGEQSEFYRNGIASIRANAAAEGRALTDDEQRKIWEYEDALLNINTALMDIVETVENSVMEEFERLSDEVQENIDRFDTFNSMLDHYCNIIKLSGRSTKDSMLLMQLSAQQTDTAMKKLNATRDKYLAQQSAQEDAAAKLAAAKAAGDEADIEYWQKQYDEITKVVEESHEAMLASWVEVLEAAEQQFEMAIEITIQKMKDGISQYGLDGLADRYEKAKTINEQYLSQLDKEYELNKMIRQIEGSIDATDNVKAKQALNKILDETNAKLAEGVELSKYDLEYMQKQLDLEMAKIALEEAQNAKSTVRLQRDSEGNFGYVYTADQDKIDDAQQKYEDKLYETRKISEEYIQEMSDLIIQNEQEMMDALAAIDRTRFETEEEYQAEVERITQYYLDRDQYLRTEMNKAIQNSGLVYADTILGQIENASSWEEAHNNLVTVTNNGVQIMIEEWAKWKKTTETAMEEAGTSSGTFTEDITSDMEDIGEATEDLAETIDEQVEHMITYMGDLMDAVQEWRDAYLDAINAIINANENLAISQQETADSFDPNTDYSALMNEYLNKGGKVGDATYNELQRQREAKITWLEGQGYDSSYWGTRGQATTDMYTNLTAGGTYTTADGQVKDQSWFTGDYVDDGKLVEIFEQLGVPLGALQESVDGIKTIVEPVNESINGGKDAIVGQVATIGQTTDGVITTTGQTTVDTINTSGENTQNKIEEGVTTTGENLEAQTDIINNEISGDTDAIVKAIGEVESAVGEVKSAVNSLASSMSSLRWLGASMDTGGYTGEWGPEGKLAFLHEKELVLSQNDTSNFLQALEFAKEMISIIDTKARMSSLFEMQATPAISAAQNKGLEQMITIHAEFPSATNHAEIEDAFNNLLNTASQYANRK